MAVSGKSDVNPFFVDDDGSQSHPHHRNLFDDEDTTYEQLIAKKEESERRQFESLNRSLVVVHETEDIGVKTAEELLRQGEQLEKTEKNLDSINAMTKVTQRHLNNIKSVFGGIKNWFQKSDSPPPPTEEPSHNKLKETLDKGSITDSGNRSLYGTKTSTDTSYALYNEDNNYQARATHSSQNAMDSQLSMLSEGLHRLKGLGEGMHEELQRQDKQIDRISEKTDKSDLAVKDQTKQTRALLR